VASPPWEEKNNLPLKNKDTDTHCTDRAVTYKNKILTHI